MEGFKNKVKDQRFVVLGDHAARYHSFKHLVESLGGKVEVAGSNGTPEIVVDFEQSGTSRTNDFWFRNDINRFMRTATQYLYGHRGGHKADGLYVDAPWTSAERDCPLAVELTRPTQFWFDWTGNNNKTYRYKDGVLLEAVFDTTCQVPVVEREFPALSISGSGIAVCYYNFVVSKFRLVVENGIVTSITPMSL